MVRGTRFILNVVGLKKILVYDHKMERRTRVARGSLLRKTNSLSTRDSRTRIRDVRTEPSLDDKSAIVSIIFETSTNSE